MRTGLAFSKYHGLGNDFVVLDAIADPALLHLDLVTVARIVCDRHTGIGADGLLVLASGSRTGHAIMRVYNSDGSDGGMCGNGVRCIAKRLVEMHGFDATSISIEVSGQDRAVRCRVRDGTLIEATVDMGAPQFDAKSVPVLWHAARCVGAPLREVTPSSATDAGRLGACTVACVSMGNPHLVLFLDSESKSLLMNRDALCAIGKKLENDPAFPERANVQFVSVLSANEIDLRTWERGSGWTLACGTGACAAVACGVDLGLLGRRVLVHLAGGDLTIEWSESSNRIAMTGPAAHAFDGVFTSAHQASPAQR